MFVILLKEYNDINKSLAQDLHAELRKSYAYAEKCTICVVINYNGDREELERNEYFFLKIFADKINIIPAKSDKTKTISIVPIKDNSDLTGFFMDPYDHFDGLCIAKYVEFLSTANDGDVFKYPKIINPSFLRYWAEKLFTVNFIK